MHAQEGKEGKDKRGDLLVSTPDVRKLAPILLVPNEHQVLILARVALGDIGIVADLIEADRAVDIERRLELVTVGWGLALV
jgi:hypothetical protein